jgi:hypothetical protein
LILPSTEGGFSAPAIVTSLAGVVPPGSLERTVAAIVPAAPTERRRHAVHLVLAATDRREDKRRMYPPTAGKNIASPGVKKSHETAEAARGGRPGGIRRMLDGNR